MSSTRDEQDANVSTHQQVQGSIQAQDTSPPALPTALPQAEQSVIVLPLKSKPRRSKPIKRILIGIAIGLIPVGTVLAVLSGTGTIAGPWSSIWGTIVASAGAVIALIQAYLRFATISTPSVVTTPLSSSAQPLDSPNGDFSIPRPSGQEGILVVYTKRSLRGFSIALCRGFWEDANPYAAQNIVGRKIRGHTYYIAVFESLLPGHYTAHIYRREMTAKVTVYPGKVTEIDWR